MKNVSLDSVWGRNSQEAEVETIENFKGSILTKILVTSVRSSCDMGVDENDYWIVFANDWGNYQAIFPCGYDVKFIGLQGFERFTFLQQSFNKIPETVTVVKKNLNATDVYTASYKNAMLEGKLIMYASNGNKALEANYHKGVLSGECIIWYPDKQMRRRCHYKDSLLHGLYETWFPNGKKENFFTYANDKFNGPHKTWDKFGNITSFGNYRDNRSTDSSFSWYSIDTSVVAARLDMLIFSDGISIDSIKKWNSIRQLKRLTVSDSLGNLLHLLEYYKNGSLAAEINYESDNKLYIKHTYHFNGITKEVSIYKVVGKNEYGSNDTRYIFEEYSFENDGKKKRKTFFDKEGKEVIKVYELENGVEKIIFERKGKK